MPDSGAGLALASRNAGSCKRVAAIARLGKCVGPEAKTDFVRHDVVDDGVVAPGVEVVNELRALVAEPTRVFETYGALHAPKSSGSRLARMGPAGDDIATRLARLVAIDGEFGERAKTNVVAYRRKNGIGDEPYEFPTYRSAEERKVWVHKWWVRPFRFFYRHLPLAIRSRIKRVAT